MPACFFVNGTTMCSTSETGLMLKNHTPTIEFHFAVTILTKGLARIKSVLFLIINRYT